MWLFIQIVVNVYILCIFMLALFGVSHFLIVNKLWQIDTKTVYHNEPFLKNNKCASIGYTHYFAENQWYKKFNIPIKSEKSGQLIYGVVIAHSPRCRDVRWLFLFVLILFSCFLLLTGGALLWSFIIPLSIWFPVMFLDGFFINKYQLLE